MSDEKSQKLGGIKMTAEMLSGLDVDTQERLLLQVARENPELAVQLRKRLFTFDHVLKLDDSILQKILREVSQRTLALSLRGVSADVLALVLRNLPTRARESLTDEIAALGPQKKADVETAREALIELAKQYK